jgi:hypothetical protein
LRLAAVHAALAKPDDGHPVHIKIGRKTNK